MADNDVRSKQGGARVRLPPPLVFVAAIVAGWLIPDLRLHGSHAARIAIGALLIAGGLSIGIGAIRLFRKTGQDAKPWTPSPELLLEGPYRFSRNPMYVGMTLFTLAAAALSGHGWIAVLAPFALAVVHYTAVLPEERYLTAKFGESYVLYKTRVRRYL
ncbi:MAG: isoprenylcysteine carboxylmethyltransferase family protein [Myxococcales bacterium]|nr:isoprenylcysteine carboxylmethyltransferase family protein [Myxococcales bacterium]